MVTAGRQTVDVHLHAQRPHHGRGTGEETEGDLLDWGEADAVLAERWVEENIADRDEDEEGEGVEVVQDIGWEAVELHSCGLSSQIVNDLVVGQPEERVPSEDGAGGKSTTHLVDPGIVKGVPSWTLVARDSRWLDRGPECAVVHVPPGPERVDGPAALGGAEEESEGLADDGALW